jgi:hypothetical protein
MADDLKRIEKSGSESIAALRSILTALEITNTLTEKALEINPLMGGPVMIKTIEPTYHGFTPRNYRLVTELSTAMLRSQMEALRRLDPSPSKVLTLDIGGRVDGVMRPTNDGTGTSVITISLVDSGRT